MAENAVEMTAICAGCGVRIDQAKSLCRHCAEEIRAAKASWVYDVKPEDKRCKR